MTLKLGLSGFKNKQCKSEFCDGVQSHTQSANNLPNIPISRLLRPQLSAELLERWNKFRQMYSWIYKRCRHITSKAHEHRNRNELGRSRNVGQDVFLEKQALDLTKSQKLKQLSVDYSQSQDKSRIQHTKYKKMPTLTTSRLGIVVT